MTLLRQLRAASALIPVTALVAGSPASAAEERIAIELNKVEETDEGCRTLFVFENRTDHQLSSFRVDLILFDPKGVFARQLILDMAPLHADKKSVASFVLDEDGCGDIGSILINDIPACANGTGIELDCLGLLSVGSRSAIPLEK